MITLYADSPVLVLAKKRRTVYRHFRSSQPIDILSSNDSSRARPVTVVCALCLTTAASTALRLITLLRPSDQSLAVEHVNTSEQLRGQPYWYHPCVVRL